jgi:TonB family protein
MTMRNLMILFVAGTFLLAGAQAPPPATPGAIRPAGAQLTAEQAQDIEKTLEKDPENPGLRIQVMRFYFQSRQREPLMRHITWLLEHAPASPVASLGANLLYAPSPSGALFTPDDIAKVKSAYDQQVQAHPNDVPLALSAALFFQLSDVLHAEEILKKAHQTNPADGSVQKQLARLYVQCIVQESMKVTPGRAALRDPKGTHVIAEREKAELVTSDDKLLVGEAARMLAGVPVDRPQFQGVKEFRDRVSERAAKLGATAARGITDTGRTRVAPEVQAQKLKIHPQPVYPAEAKEGRVQGKVFLEVVIGKDGKAASTRLIGGNPVLAPAAQEAVKQWEWEPTLVNGQPVEVVTSVEVEFKLPS